MPPWWHAAFPSVKSRRGKGKTSRGKIVRQHSYSNDDDNNDKDHSWSSTTSFRRSNSVDGPCPLPLPLPELQDLLRLDSKPLSPRPYNFRLPSPGRKILAKDKAKSRPKSFNALGSKLAIEETKRKIEKSLEKDDFESRMGMFSDQNPLDNNGNLIPTLPNSSFRVPGETSSPRYVTPPVCYQVWSAPDCDENMSSSVDNSPLHSPNVNNRYGRVYPLPRPRSASLLNLAPMSYQIPVTAPEMMIPVKSHWQKGKLIGRGTFGSVYAASHRQTGALCAMKEVEILHDCNKSSESIKQLEQEIQVLSNLQHPNIVQYYGSEIVGDKFYIYLEYVHPGAITKFINDHCEQVSEPIVRNFTRHILCGLAYLHSTKTIHRDIKGANLLVDAFGVVKLADFGMAKHLKGNNQENLSLKGSPYWMAPELLQSVMQDGASSEVALAVDIWSLGCTVIEMLTGRPPWSEYEGAAAMFKVLQETPPIPDNLSEEGRDFLNCCFKRNPAERASAMTLLEHPFLNQNDETMEISSGESGHRKNVSVTDLSPRSILETIPGSSPSYAGRAVVNLRGGMNHNIHYQD